MYQRILILTFGMLAVALILTACTAPDSAETDEASPSAESDDAVGDSSASPTPSNTDAPRDAGQSSAAPSANDATAALKPEPSSPPSPAADPQSVLPGGTENVEPSEQSSGADAAAPPSENRGVLPPCPVDNSGNPGSTCDTAFKYKGLIDVLDADPTFVVDLKYATEDNFTGIAHYDSNLCLINVDAARALVKAQQLAAKDGFQLKLFDVYRPISVQQALSDSAPAHLRKYVPAPSKYSQHCRGIAVDCTLVDSSGTELQMPSGFDDFSKKAHAAYKGGNKAERANRDYLIGIMKKAGFRVNELEWWHFYLPNVTDYQRLDVSQAEFANARDKYASEN